MYQIQYHRFHIGYLWILRDIDRCTSSASYYMLHYFDMVCWHIRQFLEFSITCFTMGACKSSGTLTGVQVQHLITCCIILTWVAGTFVNFWKVIQSIWNGITNTILFALPMHEQCVHDNLIFCSRVHTPKPEKNHCNSQPCYFPYTWNKQSVHLVKLAN